MSFLRLSLICSLAIFHCGSRASEKLVQGEDGSSSLPKQHSGKDDVINEIHSLKVDQYGGVNKPILLHSVSNDGKYVAQIAEKIFQSPAGKLFAIEEPDGVFHGANRQVIRRLPDGKVAVIIGQSLEVKAQKGPFAVSVPENDRIVYGYEGAQAYGTKDVIKSTFFGKEDELLLYVIPEKYVRLDLHQLKVIGSNASRYYAGNWFSPTEPVLGYQDNTHRDGLCSHAQGLFNGGPYYMPLHEKKSWTAVEIGVPGSEGDPVIRSIGYQNESLLASYNLGLVLWKLPQNYDTEKATIQHALRFTYDPAKQTVFEVQLVGKHQAAVYWQDRLTRQGHVDLYDLSANRQTPLASHAFKGIFKKTSNIDFITADAGRYLCFRDPAEKRVKIMKAEDGTLKGPWSLIDPASGSEFNRINKISTARLSPQLVLEAVTKLDSEIESVRMLHVELEKLTSQEPNKNAGSFESFFPQPKSPSENSRSRVRSQSE